MHVKSSVSYLSRSSLLRYLQARLVNTCHLKTQSAGFKGILNGEFDDMPEQAFYMVGSIEEAQEKAKSM